MYKNNVLYGFLFIIGLTIFSGMHGMDSMKSEMKVLSGLYALEILEKPSVNQDIYKAKLKFKDASCFFRFQKEGSNDCLALERPTIKKLEEYLLFFSPSEDEPVEVPCKLQKVSDQTSLLFRAPDYNDKEVSLRITLSSFNNLKTVLADGIAEQEEMMSFSNQKNHLYTVCKIGAWGVGIVAVLYYAVQMRYVEKFITQWLKQR